MNSAATNSNRKLGAVVLCGGKSTRMGTSKALLKFGDESLLQRVVRILKECVDKVVIVGAAGQKVPLLPDDVYLVRDEYPNKGPLSGIYSGLKKLHQLSIESAFVTSCDSPFLSPHFVEHILQLTGEETDIAMVDDGEFQHVLSAAYCTSLFSSAKELIEDNRLRPLELTKEHNTTFISMEDARKYDRNLDTFTNLNSPEDYQAALKRLQIDNE